MPAFFTLEFTHPAPKVTAVEYKHVSCKACGTFPVDRVGGTAVRFTKKSEIADFSRTAQGVLARQSVIDHLTQFHISGWRPGCVQVDKGSRLDAYNLDYCELIIVGHTIGYSKCVQLEVNRKCDDCGRQRFAYPREGLALPEECWDGSDIFVIEELGVRVVTEAFREVVERYQHTGLVFVSPSEWRDPFNSLKD